MQTIHVNMVVHVITVETHIIVIVEHNTVEQTANMEVNIPSSSNQFKHLFFSSSNINEKKNLFKNICEINLTNK